MLAAAVMAAAAAATERVRSLAPNGAVIPRSRAVRLPERFVWRLEWPLAFPALPVIPALVIEERAAHEGLRVAAVVVN